MIPIRKSLKSSVEAKITIGYFYLMKWLLTALLMVQPVHSEWSKEDQSVVQQILPTTKESAWLTIPWRTNLWDARQEAAKSGKPIYLWEMDGHPLGCV